MTDILQQISQLSGFELFLLGMFTPFFLVAIFILPRDILRALARRRKLETFTDVVAELPNRRKTGIDRRKSENVESLDL